ncbi:MAG: carboxymuconolactone decarboxylase family protein [Sneathiellales bacterium]|nr:carboxymuconolactone decarboxylase family protein [Sneathiellales bacterium]
MSVSPTAIAYERYQPHILQTLGSVSALIGKTELDPKIRHLVDLRASQINGCEYCVNMHIAEALEDGESQDRLDKVVVWRRSDLFTPGEKAAFAWTEALTDLKADADYESLRAELKLYYTEDEISVLTVAIAMINLWNRVQVSKY